MRDNPLETASQDADSQDTGRPRCSDAARARGDKLVGTASIEPHWFLIEQAGNWGASAWAGLDLDEDAKEELEELLEDAEARLMLIRRPAREARDGAASYPRRWCVIRSEPGTQPLVVWGTAQSAEDLIAAAALLEDPDAEIPGADAQSRQIRPGQPELLLVCTHGRKDVCCAVRGRPVAGEVARRWPEATWECTHTGGDRFAANLIVLPEGACYGELEPENVLGVVSAHLAGRVDPTYLRGPTGVSLVEQAAMVEAYQRFAPLAFTAVRPVETVETAESWQVRLAVAGVGEVEVSGHTVVTEPEFLTCKAGIKKKMHVPVVDAVRVNGEPAS